MDTHSLETYSAPGRTEADWIRLTRLVSRLASATAGSAELLAELEESNHALSRANALGAELMAQVEEQHQRISSLNQALGRANASSAELVAELQVRTEELQHALDHVKTLQGLLPICMHCHKIRDDGSVWQRLESYVTSRTDAKFTHGLCPDCLETEYPEK